MRCGPERHLDGFDYRTSVQGTLADLLAHRPLPLGMCRDLSAGIELQAGGHELQHGAPADRSWCRTCALQQRRRRGSRAPCTRTVAGRWETHAPRSVQVGPGPAAVLAVPENANDGWVATVDGHRLTPTRVDGWQQAWLVPAGAGGVVTLDFTPDTSYRTRLLVGALAALVLLVALAIAGPAAVAHARRGGLAVGADRAGGAHRRAGRHARAGGADRVPAGPPGPTPVAAVVLALGGMAAATVVAVTGRLLGLGQDWAYGAPAQAALQIAVAAVVAACIDWFIDAERTTSPARHGRH